MKKQTGVKVLIIGVILVCLVLGYFYYLSNKKPKQDSKDGVKISAAQELLLRNLDKNYPPTPREVVKYFCEVAQCLYGGDYTDEEFTDLAMQARKLYDEELLANNTEKQYIENLKWDVNQFKEEGVVISSFAPASSVDVEQFTQDGYSWAQMRCTFTLRKGTKLASSKEIFLLRKDADGHWKIYGWTMDEDGGQNGSGQ
ncbi:MAG: hypothetical protein K2H52_06825 [Lachnospiraceae bacterium]|nr:hypothetical protein [Lachnospiraceae bacterium]MDE7286442.1 hypothetical protein [Lachnospiraceae bacterium]